MLAVAHRGSQTQVSQHIAPLETRVPSLRTVAGLGGRRDTPPAPPSRPPGMASGKGALLRSTVGWEALYGTATFYMQPAVCVCACVKEVHVSALTPMLLFSAILNNVSSENAYAMSRHDSRHTNTTCQLPRAYIHSPNTWACLHP